jgi:hypothetical protein
MGPDGQEDLYDEDGGSDFDTGDKDDYMRMASTFTSKQIGARFTNKASKKHKVLSSDKTSLVTGNNLSCASPTSIRQQILKKEGIAANAQKNYEAYKLYGIHGYFQNPKESKDGVMAETLNGFK